MPLSPLHFGHVTFIFLKLEEILKLNKEDSTNKHIRWLLQEHLCISSFGKAHKVGFPIQLTQM